MDRDGRVVGVGGLDAFDIAPYLPFVTMNFEDLRTSFTIFVVLAKFKHSHWSSVHVVVAFEKSYSCMAFAFRSPTPFDIQSACMIRVPMRPPYEPEV